MSQATEILGASRAPHVRLVAAIGAAHFVSHYYILLLAPLLPFVRADYAVSYTQIGLALAAFNVVSTVLQTPVGFLVDWLGARILLIMGLLIGASAFMVAGLVDSFWMLVAMFALAGVGNTVYHPADYALLSHHVPADRIGQAFSIHTFAGMLGSAVAPASLLMMQNVWGWRGAFIGAGVLGFAVAAILLAVRESPVVQMPPAPRAADDKTAVGWRLLMSPPILLNLLFFMLLAMISGGIYNYSVVALGVMYGTPVTSANIALTGFLALSATGVLIGGLLVARTTRHAMVATIGLLVMGLIMALIAQVDLGSLLLIAAMSLGGFFSGVIMPSARHDRARDYPARLVRQGVRLRDDRVQPRRHRLALIFGAIMDHGSPSLVFLLVAAFSLIAIATVAVVPRRAG
ncbi:MAG: MFS transporter [Pseudolabrys sp.]